MEKFEKEITKYAVITINHEVINENDESEDIMYIINKDDINLIKACDIKLDGYADVDDDTECKIISYRNKMGNYYALVRNPNYWNDFDYVDDELAAKVIKAYLEDDNEDYEFKEQEFYENSFYVAKVYEK